MYGINRDYKDRLFCFIFGREENKQWALDLYNAMNETKFDNLADVEIKTMENFLYIGMRNDVALLVQDVINSFEHQSTFNPNMPIRQLIYISRLYEKYIKENKMNIYSTKLIRIPKAKFVVFYNGKEEHDDVILKLSDCFLNTNTEVESDIEVSVKMVNINYGENSALLSKCKVLEEYSWFIERVRLYSVDMDISDAVNTALSEMQEDSILKPYLSLNKTEVCGMLFTEFDVEEAFTVMGEEKFKEGKEEGLKQGKEEGLKQGKEEAVLENIKNLVISMDIPVEKAMDALKIPEEDRARYIDLIGDVK